MERAAAITQEFANQRQRYAVEQQQRQQQAPQMPEHVAKWLAEHPQYVDPTDAVAQAELNLATQKCVRDGLTWDDSNFIGSLERHLGLRSNGHAAGNGQVETAPAQPSRNPAPAVARPQPQYSG